MKTNFYTKPRKPLKRSGFKRKPKSKQTTKRPKLPKLSTLRNQCDSLLTPIIKLTTPHCEACGQMTQVAHHWIEKSRSSYLRYNLDNLVALCNMCHSKIHNVFGNNVSGGIDVGHLIITRRGIEWYERMKVEARTMIAVNRQYYIENKSKLEFRLAELKAQSRVEQLKAAGLKGTFLIWY